MRHALVLAVLALAAASPPGKITLGPHPWPAWVRLHRLGVTQGYGALRRGDNGTQAEQAAGSQEEAHHKEAHEEHAKEQGAAEQAHAQSGGHGGGHSHSQGGSHGHGKGQKVLAAAEDAYQAAQGEAAEESFEATEAKGEAVMKEASTELGEADQLQAKAQQILAKADGNKTAAKEAAAELEAAAKTVRKTAKEHEKAVAEREEEVQERQAAQAELRQARAELEEARQALAGEPGHGHAGHGGGHGDGHGGHAEGGHGAPSSQGAHSVAVGLIFTVVMLPLVTWMALSEGVVHELTMKMLDTFVSIFLAVLWFSAFSQVLETFRIKEAFPGAVELASVAQVLFLYCIAMAVAWVWRDKQMALTTFCSCGAHYIAFAGISATGSTQYATADSIRGVVPKASEPVVSFLFCAIVMAVLGAASFTCWYLWRRKVDHPKLHHNIEELELDILGLVISFLVTQAVRHAITGRFPPMAHMLLQRDFGLSPGHFVHKAWQRWFMLGWSIFLTLFAGLFLPKLNQYAHDHKDAVGKWASRGLHVMKVIVIMLVAWGYLLWAEWEFYENLFHGDVMFGHMVFAVLATFACLLFLYTLAWVGDRAEIQTPAMRETNAITVTGVSLVAAWSWEHCFNIAFDVIGQEYQVGFGGLVPKMVLAILIPAVLLPTYVKHVRGRVMELEEMHGHGHGDEESHEHVAH